ncbi:MAG: sigma-70 family RNA polymerase sigma factor [Gemmatimonadetes bacterium]|nr:sigma-70 family RNA polymerase sigma factor [Gemmatimonadota bacterium]
MSRQESTVLLRAARGGSPEALGELYARCGTRLLAFIRLRMGRDLRLRVESRDILQATLLKSFQRIQQFEGDDGATLMGWLVRIAENEIRDQVDYQHRQRRNVAAGVPIDAGGIDVPASVRSALSAAVLNEEAERLGAALETLDPDHREVIVLRKLEELSFKDVAARMGRSEDTCRKPCS